MDKRTGQQADAACCPCAGEQHDYCVSGMPMSAFMMWLGMAAFFFAFIFANIAKARLRQLQKLAKEPDKQYNGIRRAAQVLFALGMTLWIAGAVMTMAGGR